MRAHVQQVLQDAVQAIQRASPRDWTHEITEHGTTVTVRASEPGRALTVVFHLSVTACGALQVAGATEVEVPQLGRLTVTPTIDYDGDTAPTPFNPVEVLAGEYARAIVMWESGGTKRLPEQVRRGERRDQ